MVSSKTHFFIATLLALTLVGGLQAYRWPWQKPKPTPKPFANDLILGSLGPNSQPLYANYHNRTGLPSQILYANVEYKGLKNITRIRAMDLATNGTGGFARILSGGIGQRNVTIQLSSAQAGLGYYFYVDIFGY